METVMNRQLFLVEARIKTFKNWPFNDKNKCNVKNMAEAGFYSVATGDDDADAAKCFLCGKELDGWEANDDPWQEHKSHAAKCAFVQLGRKEDELLLSEYLSVIKQYMINEIKQVGELSKEHIDEKAKHVRRKYLSKK
ncbi:baculoviral IAP repeat-containing protein 5 [Galleria mellonella]|uniref:Baculoviral IAP repeat-containing protein 5 n=1 Tax=Galleria mellonella TaxID=7137 RepID=A0A6J1WY14_GALME|nr:baculoviral IAP repeat-containing protein 5 [Galleria mellonella]